MMLVGLCKHIESCHRGPGHSFVVRIDGRGVPAAMCAISGARDIVRMVTHSLKGMDWVDSVKGYTRKLDGTWPILEMSKVDAFGSECDQHVTPRIVMIIVGVMTSCRCVS